MAAYSLFLGYPYIPILTSFAHVNYATYIINVFYRENLTFRTVTSIHNTQKMDQKELETWKKDRGCSITSRGMIQVIKEKEIKLICKNVCRKKRKGLRKRMSLIHLVKVILILLLKNISHQKIPRHSGIAVNIQ